MRGDFSVAKWGVGFEEQAVLVWKNIQFILGKFGLDCSSIVATTTFLSDPNQAKVFFYVAYNDPAGKPLIDNRGLKT